MATSTSVPINLLPSNANPSRYSSAEGVPLHDHSSYSPFSAYRLTPSSKSTIEIYGAFKRTPSIRASKKSGGGWHPEPKRPSIREYYAQRGPTLTRSIRKSLRAEERVAIQQIEEVEAFRQALSHDDASKQDTRKQAHHALTIARAVLETASAEKRLATSLVHEAEVYLQSTHAMADAMDEKLALAEEQLGDLLEAAHSQGFPTAEPSHCDVDRRPSSPSSHRGSRHSDETGSDIDSDTSDADLFFDVLSDEAGSSRSRDSG